MPRLQMNYHELQSTSYLPNISWYLRHNLVFKPYIKTETPVLFVLILAKY